MTIKELLVRIRYNGVILPRRRVLEFTGSVTVTDDPANNKTIITIA